MRRLAPLALLLAACSTDFAPQYRVEDLRILAVRSLVPASGSADAAPGETLGLEALVANPAGRSPLSVRWFLCLPPPPGEIPACLDPDLLGDPAALAAHPSVVELPSGLATTFTVPDGPEVQAAVALAVDLATRNPSFACRLYVELPVVAVAEAEAERDVAVKRVRIVPPAGSLPPALAGKYLTNLNPSVERIYRDPVDEDLCLQGTPLAGGSPFPADAAVLCGLPTAPGGPYNQCAANGDATEVREFHFWQWYVTAGEFPDFDGIGNAVGDSVDFERPPGAFTLWAILRDGRGGVDWRQLDFAAPPPP